jgi:hypothetical protein
MRHYDRSEFRHLDDAQRYRDHEFKADDAWVGPNEVPPEARPPRPAPSASARTGWIRPAARRRVHRVRTVLSRLVEAIFHPRRVGTRAMRAAVRAITQRVRL